MPTEHNYSVTKIIIISSFHRLVISGTASPLNSGWYLAIPDTDIFNQMRTLAAARIDSKWDKHAGWGTIIPDTTRFRGGKKVKSWTFNGASLDQGLLFHTFALHGTAMLLDEKNAILYSDNGENLKTMRLKTVYKICGGDVPVKSFIHYTGG